MGGGPLLPDSLSPRRMPPPGKGTAFPARRMNLPDKGMLAGSGGGRGGGAGSAL